MAHKSSSSQSGCSCVGSHRRSKFGAPRSLPTPTMASETSAHLPWSMGAAAFLIQLPHDRHLSERRFDRHPRAKLMARRAGIRPGRAKDKFSMGIVPCLLGNLSQRSAMLRMAPGAGLPLDDQRAMPPGHGRRRSSLKIPFSMASDATGGTGSAKRLVAIRTAGRIHMVPT